MEDPHQPYGHYLEWCNDKYSPTNNTVNLANNLYYTSIPAQPLKLNSDWVPEWVAQWQPFNSTAGVLKGKDLADLPGDSLSWVKAILNKLHDVVQEPLQTKAPAATGNDKWSLFRGEYSWEQAPNNLKPNLCITYNLEVVEQTKYIYNCSSDEYLRVWVGKGVNNQKYFDYAHRLVCMAFKGGPNDWSKNGPVVNHKCDNPACLNPRHLEWVSKSENKTYKADAVGWA
jgi:hypothetical protein